MNEKSACQEIDVEHFTLFLVIFWSLYWDWVSRYFLRCTKVHRDSWGCWLKCTCGTGLDKRGDGRSEATTIATEETRYDYPRSSKEIFWTRTALLQAQISAKLEETAILKATHVAEWYVPHLTSPCDTWQAGRPLSMDFLTPQRVICQVRSELFFLRKDRPSFNNFILSRCTRWCFNMNLF
jgi:hypothetical protein